MKVRLLRLIGKGLVIVGFPLLLLLSYAVFSVLTYTGEYGPLPYEVSLLPPFILLGISMSGIGVILLKRFEERMPFLAKDGGPIHSGKPWKKGSESGLYLTSCGLVVSINKESEETAHVGYMIVPAKRATHRECVEKEGGAILEKHAHGRAQ